MSHKTFQLWNRSLQEAVYSPGHEANTGRSGLVIYDKFRFIWTSRSTEFIAQLYLDMLHQWDDIVCMWGWNKRGKGVAL